MTAGVRLSVVVATRDRPEMLAECVHSVLWSVGPVDEVLVVDSCSSGPGTAEVARRAGVRLVVAPRPGASLARNLGWRAASGDVVCFVDDDVQVGRSWAAAVRAAFAGRPEVAFVTGRLDLRAEDAGAERPVAYFAPGTPFTVDADVVDGFGHGANLAVRRSVLDEIGGYDEALGPGAPWHAAEDLELVDRLLAAGHVGRHEPGAEAVHVQWRRRPDLLRLEWRYGIGQGARLARLRRLDPARFSAVRRIVWREQGLGALRRSVGQRHEFETASSLLRLAGTAVGQATAGLAARRDRRTGVASRS